jgi:membrane dipeptidase
MYKVADLHCDTIWRVRGGTDLAIRSRTGHIDIPRLREGGVALQVFAAFVRPRQPAETYYDEALTTIRLIRKMTEDYGADLELVTNADQVARANRRGKIGVLISLEGMHPVDGDTRRIRTLHGLGVRIISITWNNSNAFAASAYDETHGMPQGIRHGLTTLGERAVREMERLGILIDVSHLGERAFWRLIEMAQRPVIASHSLSRSVYNHFRNMTDAQVLALAETGGVIGVNFCSAFLAERRRGTVDDVAEHVERLVEIGGIGCAALGSDFDGISRSPRGLDHMGMMQNLAAALDRRGFSERQIAKVMMGNFMRVFRTVCGD